MASSSRKTAIITPKLMAKVVLPVAARLELVALVLVDAGFVCCKSAATLENALCKKDGLMPDLQPRAPGHG